MLNIVLPIAGRGSRFLEAGYLLPKPLIPVHGKAMIEVVVGNIRPGQPHRFTFLVLEEHLENTGIREVLLDIAPGCNVLPVSQVTEGAACTVLLAQEIINNDDPLMLANSDQWVDININDYLAVMEQPQADGLMMSMRADNPKWSFVRLDENGWVTQVAEKQVISNEATVGIYNFRHGSDYVRAAEQMIAGNIRVNNEFYVAPVFNEMIDWGARIAVCNVGREYDGMYGIGTPDDLKLFLAHPASRKSVSFDG